VSETYAHQGLGVELMWDRHVLRDLGFPQRDPSPAWSDNDGVVIQSTKAINHAGAKHYRIAQAQIRQLNDDLIMDTKFVRTGENVTDYFNKALLGPAFIKHRLANMGPQVCP
jgi:hypothetical protein